MENNESKVKIKFLKNAGPYVIGQEAEVDADTAKTLCTIRKRWNGEKLIDHRLAMPMEEVEKIKNTPIDKGGLTIEEARELKIDMRVETPKEELERPLKGEKTSKGKSAK